MGGRLQCVKGTDPQTKEALLGPTLLIDVAIT